MFGTLAAAGSSAVSGLSLTSIVTLVGALVVIPAVVYFFFWPDAPGLPPRFAITKGLLTGEFKMKESGPMGLIKKGYQKHGDIFRMKLAHRGITVLIGPEAQGAFFEPGDDELNQKAVYQFTVPVFGKNIVYDAPQKIMTQQLKFVSKGLMQSTMRTHCGKITKEVEDYFAKWGDEGEVDLFESLSELTILTASRCLLGQEVRENIQTEFATLYQELSDGMSHLSVIAPNLPTSAHIKRDRARAKIVAIFSKIIQTRRNNNNADGHDDFLQTLIDSTYKDGRSLGDEEITGLLLAALFAGQHTSNITSTWTGFLVLDKKKELLPRILEEQKRIMGKYDGEITVDGLAEMTLLHGCMQEALRMYPPLIMLMRKVLKDQKYKGYTIPKGDIAVVCPPVAHRLPEVFANPEDYDPDRFGPGREEDEKTKWSFIAFGGGRHACLGRRFAFLQIKTIWSILFRKFDFELVSPVPKVNFEAIVVGPTPPCIVKYKRKPADKQFEMM